METMYYIVGETFDLKGKKYEVVPGWDCSACAFRGTDECIDIVCMAADRPDNINVLFNILENENK